MSTTHTSDDSIPTSPPRSPRSYQDTPHYLGRIRCDRRPIDRHLVRNAIRYGDVDENPEPRPNSWRFVYDVDGMRIAVVVGEDKYRPVLSKITAYVDVADAVEAYTSDRWSEDELYVAAMLETLVGGSIERLDKIRIDVTDPVSYHGHKLVFQEGYTEPFCLRCHMSSCDKSDFVDRRCLDT